MYLETSAGTTYVISILTLEYKNQRMKRYQECQNSKIIILQRSDPSYENCQVPKQYRRSQQPHPGTAPTPPFNVLHSNVINMLAAENARVTQQTWSTPTFIGADSSPRWTVRKIELHRAVGV
jgi:hypothetical protein